MNRRSFGARIVATLAALIGWRQAEAASVRAADIPPLPSSDPGLRLFLPERIREVLWGGARVFVFTERGAYRVYGTVGPYWFEGTRLDFTHLDGGPVQFMLWDVGLYHTFRPWAWFPDDRPWTRLTPEGIERPVPIQVAEYFYRQRPYAQDHYWKGGQRWQV